MYRYLDGNGNEFVLQMEAEAKVTRSRLAASATLPMSEAMLDQHAYMRLVLAFSLAIDNKICQCELRNANSAMITTLQDGHQRRYFLVADSQERLELETLLRGCFATEAAS